MIKERSKLHIALNITLIVALVLGVGVLVLLLLHRNGTLGNEPEQTVEQTEASQATQEQTLFETEPVPETTESPIPLNRFSPQDFAYDGDYLTCISEECLMGLDVSKYQSEIDWEQVKEAGFSFVMIRVGYRGYGTAGTMRPDEMAEIHYQGAKEAGLMIGAYFFSQAVSVEEAREEALYAMELTQNWELDLPIVYDWEFISDTARTADVDADTLTACAKAFCQEISDVGKKTMIYVSPWYGNLHLDQLKEYPQWIALYKDHMDYKYHFDMWQYTSKGKVPGVSGDVDINIFIPYGQNEVWP